MTNTSIQPTKQWIQYPKTTRHLQRLGKQQPHGHLDNLVEVRDRADRQRQVYRCGADGTYDLRRQGLLRHQHGHVLRRGQLRGCRGQLDPAAVRATRPCSSGASTSSRPAARLRATSARRGPGICCRRIGTRCCSRPSRARSAAAPYSDLTATNSNGQPKLRKIAVLMTDGDYNINYCKGVEAKNSDQTPDINCNSENGKSQPQATSLCTAIKQRGKIEVYTVGFQVSSAAKTFLTELRHRRQPLLRRHDRSGAAGGLPRHRAEDRHAAPDELTSADADRTQGCRGRASRRPFPHVAARRYPR